MNIQLKADELLRLFRKRYPTIPELLSAKNAWERLVATLLSAQSTDARINIITPHFFALWPTPQDIVDVPQEEVEGIIRSAGFFRNKAKHILASAKKIIENFNGEVPQTLEELITLDGVARKTANVILWEQFKKNEGIAIDTHVNRIMNRVGLTKEQNPNKVEQDLMKLFPRESWGDINKMSVWFGREVCDAKKPKCNDCPLTEFCSSAFTFTKKPKKLS